MTGSGAFGRWIAAAATSSVVVALGITHVAAIGRVPANLAQGPTVGVESQAAGDASVADDVDPRYPPAISGAGAVIAYTHAFDTSKSELLGVIVVDLTIPIGQPGHARPVDGTPETPPNTPYRYVGLREPSVSDDGRFVAFTSDANSSKPTPDWNSGQIPGDFASSQVFLWDRLNPDPNSAVKRASLGPDSVANGDASTPAISADGTYVAFASTAVNLVIGASLPP